MNEHPIHGSTSYLLSQICKLYRALANQYLEVVGVHQGQELILCELAQHNGQPQSELAQRLCVQPPTLTNALNSMEKAGLVQRRTDEVDQRVSRVYLTETAVEVQPQIDQIWSAIEDQAFAKLSPEERSTLHRLLNQVYQNLTPQCEGES